MLYFSEIILVGPVTLATAWYHSRLIKKNRPIRHGVWSGLYAILVAGAIWWQWAAMPRVWQVGLFAIACAIGRLVVFNISLNWFRGLSWTYVSPTSTSILDKWELRLFGGRVWLFEAFLFVIFMILQLFI
jgi:hypothetical protein